MPRIDVGEVIQPVLDRPEMQTPEGRQVFLGERFAVRRPESPGEIGYFEFISGAIEAAHARITPELLRDPDKLNVITCVDPNAVEQAAVVSPNIAEALGNEENQVPGGLYYLWKTGLMKAWVSARMFSPFLIGSLHRSCGAFLLGEGNSQATVQVIRERVASDFYRTVDEQATLIRGFWLSGGDLNAAEREAVSQFHGPKVVGLLLSSAGTAADYIRPRNPELRADPQDVYSIHSLAQQRDGWLRSHLASKENGHA